MLWEIHSAGTGIEMCGRYTVPHDSMNLLLDLSLLRPGGVAKAWKINFPFF